MSNSRRWGDHKNDSGAPFGGNANYILVGLTAVAAIALTVIAFNVSRPAVSNAKPGPIPSFGGVSTLVKLAVPAAGSSVLIIGDSYAAGTGADHPTVDSWPHLLANDLGWNVTVDGVGGTGYTWGEGADGTGGNVFLDRVNKWASNKALTPALLLIEGGQNDYRAKPADLKTAASSAIKAAKAAWPNAAIVVLGPSAPQPLGDMLARIAEPIETAAFENKVFSINPVALHWMTKANSPGFNFDGAHVNEAGHHYLAKQIEQAMSTAEHR